MKLEKAIEIADHYDDPLRQFTIKETKAAIRLLIEAGKRVKWHKEQHKKGYYELLPGED